MKIFGKKITPDLCFLIIVSILLIISIYFIFFHNKVDEHNTLSDINKISIVISLLVVMFASINLIMKASLFKDPFSIIKIEQDDYKRFYIYIIRIQKYLTIHIISFKKKSSTLQILHR